MSRLIFLMVLVCLCLAGCVSGQPVMRVSQAANYGMVAERTRLNMDTYAGRAHAIGPVITVGDELSGMKYRVVSRTDMKGGATRKQEFRLQIRAGFPKRVFLREAYANGNRLKMEVLDRERTECGPGCTTLETVSISLSSADMDRHAAEGLEVEVLGRRASLNLSIPADYFAAVLAFHRSNVVADS